jgi:hypothetical protein
VGIKEISRPVPGCRSRGASSTRKTFYGLKLDHYKKTEKVKLERKSSGHFSLINTVLLHTTDADRLLK